MHTRAIRGRRFARGDGPLDGKLNDAATRLDPLDRDGRMLDHFTRNSFEFCFCYQQTHQTNPEQGSAKYSGSMISPPHRGTLRNRDSIDPKF
jgi:hypothetical protein